MATSGERAADVLAAPLILACGLELKNRLAKAAMSDSLGDGAGNPTEAQISLYRRWNEGGTALSIIGEVQVDPRFPETPGNLVLPARGDRNRLRALAAAGADRAGHIWPQLGHAGALAFADVSRRAGPSALRLDELTCDELTVGDIEELPARYAAAAEDARLLGFSGVEIHAGHGFLLSQFLSPLFNQRTDGYGGSIEARAQIILDIVKAVRVSTGPTFAIGVKLNATDELEGGLTQDESLVVVEALSELIDVIDVSGGTYFPGAASSSDRASSGPYYLDFAQRAREVTNAAVMLTGGFKTREQAAAAVSGEAVDLVGLARPLVIDPDLPTKWTSAEGSDPTFPRFDDPAPGSVTAWYTMRLAALGAGDDGAFSSSAADALAAFEARDRQRITTWVAAFPDAIG